MGKIEIQNQLGVPQCLCQIESNDEEHVVSGDDRGIVSILLSEPEVQRSRASTSQNAPVFEILHRHDDWVTQV